MKTFRFSFPAGALFAAALAAGQASAQSCGPLTFVFSTTGPGCDPTGPGPIPTLSGVHFPLPGIPTCPVRIQLDSNVLLFPIPIATLALGLSNPAFPLPGLPGCTLWTSLELVLSMGPDAGGPTLHEVLLFVPPDPVLIGASVHGQAALPVPGGGIRISNGIRVDIV